MKFNLFVILPFVAQALSAGPPRAIPPKATLLFSATLTGGVPAVLPSTPFGERLIVSVNNGTVSGPKLNGESKGILTDEEADGLYRPDHHWPNLEHDKSRSSES